MPRLTALITAMIALGCATGVQATPEFLRANREFRLTCMSCHTQPPKLNEFGEEFARNGYRIKGARPNRADPYSVWLSGQLSNSAAKPDTYRGIVNRVEIIAAGRVEPSRLSYFIEWRPVSQEALGDGAVRDRSGRFEDLFVIADLSPSLQLQVGQFRAMSQVDVSRRLSLSEPTAFSTSLPGRPDSDSRRQSLRGFAPSGRAPGVRLLGSLGPLEAAVTVPFPGELSIPLNSQARDTASNEFESRPKGVFLEAYRRSGMDSLGVQAFLGDNGREQFGLVGQKRVGDLWLEGGLIRAKSDSNDEWRASLTADWMPRPEFAAGLRLDHRQIAGESVAATPYVSLFRPFGEQAAKLVLEGRLQKERTPRFALELSWFR